MSNTIPTTPRFTRRDVLIGSAATLSLSACASNRRVFTFRMTMDVEAEGTVHSASSIIEVTYVIGDDGLKAWNAFTRGVSPIVDLGPYGWVVAALEENSADVGRKIRATGRSIASEPLGITKLPLYAFNLPPADINKATGKVFLDKIYPVFIWVPAGGSWRDARQLFVEELPTTIGANVKVRQVTLEPAPGAPIVTRIRIAPIWLVARRENQKTSVLGSSSQFYEFDVGQIEKGR
jgi:hypothetical protein